MRVLEPSERPLPAVDPMTPRLARVVRFLEETDDTFTLELEPAEGEALHGFHPGQFNMLYVFGVGEIPISISGDPARPERVVHTTRVVGMVTAALRKLRPGSFIGMRGPFGTAWPVDEAAGEDVLLVAGGIGLAPLRPALLRILSRRSLYGKVSLLYGARSPADILYRREIERWRARLDLDVYVTVDRATPAWRGNVGVVTTLIRRAPFDPTSAVAMICGPEVMMRFAIQEIQARGVRDEALFVSMERNMKCAVGFCGHCQYGPVFICRDGPVFRYDAVAPLFGKREI